MMLGLSHVAGLQIEQRKIRMHERFVRIQMFRQVAFGNCPGKITLAKQRHAKRQSGLETGLVGSQHGLQLCDCPGKFRPAEIKDGVIELPLKIHVVPRYCTRPAGRKRLILPASEIISINHRLLRF